jgi:hypothetical protein
MSPSKTETAPSLIDLALGHYDLPIEVTLTKSGKTLATFTDRREADAFIAANDYLKTSEVRANEGLPSVCPMFGRVDPLEQDFICFWVKHTDEEKNMTVNDKVQALLEKKGPAKRSSSVAVFRKALEQLVEDWKAESLESCSSPRYADFQDTKVVDTVHTLNGSYGTLGLVFDGSGYDLLSSQADFHIETYRNILGVLCQIHGWTWEDCTTWAITFERLD